MLPPPPTPRISRKTESGERKLTQLLEDLGQDFVTLVDGRTITRDQALAERIWDAAIGMIPGGVDEDGQRTFVKPDAKMMTLILERREGKVPTIIADDSRKLVAEDKIEEIARASINQEADALGTFSGHSEDLDMSEDGDQDTEDSG